VIVDAISQSIVNACVTLTCLCAAAKQGDKGDKGAKAGGETGKAGGNADEAALSGDCPD
jgi:hypothetical protein